MARHPVPPFSPCPYFVPWYFLPLFPFFSVESSSSRLLFLGFIKTQFRAKTRHEFQVFNGPMENRFDSHAIAANSFRAVLRLFVFRSCSRTVENGIPVDYAVFCRNPFHRVRFDCIHATFARNHAFRAFNCNPSFYKQNAWTKEETYDASCRYACT